MESFWKWRWVMVGLGAVLAVVLIANGNIVVGGLIGAMAVVRIVMFSKLQRRRTELADPLPRPFRSWQARYRKSVTRSVCLPLSLLVASSRLRGWNRPRLGGPAR